MPPERHRSRWCLMEKKGESAVLAHSTKNHRKIGEILDISRKNRSTLGEIQLPAALHHHHPVKHYMLHVCVFTCINVKYMIPRTPWEEILPLLNLPTNTLLVLCLKFSPHPFRHNHCCPGGEGPVVRWGGEKVVHFLKCKLMGCFRIFWCFLFLLGMG